VAPLAIKRHPLILPGRVGNIEFGYRLCLGRRRLEPDPAEQAALAEIRNLRRQGHTLRGIAATLNSRGHRTCRGTEGGWNRWTIARENRLRTFVAQPEAKETQGL